MKGQDHHISLRADVFRRLHEASERLDVTMASIIDVAVADITGRVPVLVKRRARRAAP